MAEKFQYALIIIAIVAPLAMNYYVIKKYGFPSGRVIIGMFIAASIALTFKEMSLARKAGNYTMAVAFVSFAKYNVVTLCLLAEYFILKYFKREL